MYGQVHSYMYGVSLALASDPSDAGKADDGGINKTTLHQTLIRHFDSKIQRGVILVPRLRSGGWGEEGKGKVG